LPPKRLVRKELSLSNRDFEVCWQLMTTTILAFMEIEATTEIKLKLRDARKFYWTPIVEQDQIVNPHWELFKEELTAL